MATQSALHPIHYLLGILSGDTASAINDGGAAESLADLADRLGWSGLAPAALDADDPHEAEPWFVRLTFPGITPPDAFIISLATDAGLRVDSLAHGPAGRSRWLLIAPQSRADISAAVARLRAAHRIHAVPFRTAEDR